MPISKILPVIFLLLFAVSCDKKKERLASDTLTISVDPQTQTIASNSQLQLKALCSGSQGSVNISPTWSVENQMGTFSPSQGKETTFNAGSSTGTVKVIASYGSVKGETTITIAEKCPDNTGGTGGSTGTVTGSGGSGGSGGTGGTGGTGGSGGTSGSGGSGGTTGGSGGGSGGDGNNDLAHASSFGLFSETFRIPGILLDTDSSRFLGGGCIGVWPDGEQTVLADGMGGDECTEGIKGIKCTVGENGGGWWMQFGSDALPGLSDCDVMTAMDLSMFDGGFLKFDIKTTKDVLIAVKWGDAMASGILPGADITLRELGVPRDGQWHSVSIPLRSFPCIDLAKVKMPVSFNAAPGSIDFTFWVDNVRWEKNP